MGRLNDGVDLYSGSLLSKWGFDDGDILKDWWEATDDTDLPCENHDLLYAVVIEYLIPEIEKAGHTVEPYRIHTNHNPVRSDTLDGVEVNTKDARATHFDKEIVVHVSAAQIWKHIDELRSE